MEASPKALETAGLTRAQFDLKEAVLQKCDRDFRGWVKGARESERRFVFGPKGRRLSYRNLGWAFWQKLAGIVVSVLQSLGVPGADAIGEFMDAVSSAK
jgi:hypothetical protein